MYGIWQQAIVCCQIVVLLQQKGNCIEVKGHC